MAVPALVQAEHLRELPAPRPVRPLGTEQVVVRCPWPEISAEVDREHAIRTGIAEDRLLVRPAVGWVLLGIPIGIVVVTSAIAVILAVYGTLVWGALLAGLYGGAIAGAYFGGVAGLGTALLREEHAGRRVTEVTVSIGPRVMAHAGPGETLVSQTAKDLVAGSSLTFEDAGEHELKGVPHSWRLYRVAN